MTRLRKLLHETKLHEVTMPVAEITAVRDGTLYKANCVNSSKGSSVILVAANPRELVSKVSEYLNKTLIAFDADVNKK